MIRRHFQFVITASWYFALVGCASFGSHDDDLIFPASQHPGISYDELSEPEAPVNSPIKRSRPEDFRTSKNDRRSCNNAFDKIVTPARELAKIAGPLPPLAPGPLGATLDLNVADCSLQASKRHLVHSLYLAAHAHGGRILVLLPLTGPLHESGNAILSGMRQALAQRQINFDELVTVRDTRGDSITAEKVLAQTVLSEPISAIIGGVTSGEARILSTWAPKMAIPVVLVSAESTETATSSFLFRVFPSEKLLARSLLDYLRTRGISSVGVLRPWRAASTVFIDEFIKQSDTYDIIIKQDIAYNRDDFNSMESAARKLFKLEVQDRPQEYAELVESKRLQAEDAGTTFNPRTVALAPIVEFDAVLIPDNFRTVRHFVQIFKYLDVRKLQLLGTHEWRSSALVEPYEPYLNGAIFPDFIGSYQKLPPGVEVTTTQSPNFVHPDTAVQLDYQLIGYHAAALLAPLVSDTELLRREIAKELADTTQQKPGFFSSGRIFDEQRNSLWPSFIFSVAGKDIVQVR